MIGNVDLTLKKASFVENNANGENGYGGAIYMKTSILQISEDNSGDVVFDGNTAVKGGRAIFCSSDTSITANGQYYIYSVNGKAFMQAGQSQVKAITTSNYTNFSKTKKAVFIGVPCEIFAMKQYLKITQRLLLVEHNMLES